MFDIDFAREKIKEAFEENDLKDSLYYDYVEDIEFSSAYDTSFGASKFVLTFKKEDNYVVKIPLMGDNEDCTATLAGIDIAGYERDEDFGNWDYCDVEAFVYREAKRAGVEAMFAETKCVDTIDGYPIYTQPTCVPYHDASNYSYGEVSDESIDSIRDMGLSTPLREDWLAAVREWYGEDMLIKLIGFIRTIGISDLHAGNYGYLRENGAPILFDYSGYTCE